MSSDTEHRPPASGPAPTAEEITAAIPRPTGPWPPSAGAVPSGLHSAPTGWAAPPPFGWSAPPAGLGSYGPATVAGVAAPARRPGMRWGWIVVAIVAAIAAVTLIGTVASAQRTMTVYGSVTIYGMSGYVTPGSSCTGAVVNGMPVTIYDAAGNLVGTTTLTGTGVARNTWSSYSYGYADSCEYSFSVSDVPASSDHYRVKAGSAPADGVGFSRDQLESSGARVTYR